MCDFVMLKTLGGSNKNIYNLWNLLGDKNCSINCPHVGTLNNKVSIFILGTNGFQTVIILKGCNIKLGKTDTKDSFYAYEEFQKLFCSSISIDQDHKCLRWNKPLSGLQPWHCLLVRKCRIPPPKIHQQSRFGLDNFYELEEKKNKLIVHIMSNHRVGFLR